MKRRPPLLYKFGDVVSLSNSVDTSDTSWFKYISIRSQGGHFSRYSVWVFPSSSISTSHLVNSKHKDKLKISENIYSSHVPGSWPFPF